MTLELNATQEMYYRVAIKLLVKLSREFDVSCPELYLDAPSKLAGTCYCGEIHINPDVLGNLRETVKTVRHEFAHYLQDLFGLKQSERKARRFEDDLMALERLPTTQKRL